MNRIQVGQTIGRKTLVDLDSAPVAIPDERRPVHLQFRRFAGCPFCSLHLRSFVRRHKVRACKYGAHADDQWPVDELLALAHDRGAP